MKQYLFAAALGFVWALLLVQWGISCNVVA